MNSIEFVYGKEGAKRILAMGTTCEKKDATLVKKDSYLDKLYGQ